MEKSIHEERYSVLKEALMHEFGERNINSSAMEEDNNIEFKLAGCSGHAHPFDLIEIIEK